MRWRTPLHAAACLIVAVLVAAGCSSGGDPIGPGAGATTADSQAPLRVFYVDPARGRDDHAGTSPRRAWATVGRVNRMDLRPGDRVLFRSGARFADATLSVEESGTRDHPISFGSYGDGRATLAGGVFLRAASHIVLDGLRVTGPNQGIASSASGRGVRDLTITRVAIADVGIGINAPNRRDSRWRIDRSSIVRTGDSAIIIEGSRVAIEDNLISGAGRDAGIPYPKHGIYAKGPRITIVGNTIREFQTEGVSTRYRDALIARNVISGGLTGVAYYRDDPTRGGTTRITGNRITGVGAGIYISPEGSAGPTVERFEIRGNVVREG